MKKIFLLCVLLNINFEIYSQDLLLNNPAPSFDGIGGAFTALPTSDPFAFHFNPAQLGNYAIENNFSYNFNDNLFTTGFNFTKYIPISIGLSYVNEKINYISTNGAFNVDDEYKSFAIGIGFKYFLQFNLGYSFKEFWSSIKMLQDGDEMPIGMKINDIDKTNDFGVQFVIPVIEICNAISKKLFPIPESYISTFDLSLGYSLLNSSGILYYKNPTQPNFFQKTAKLGYALSIGTQKEFHNKKYFVYKLSWSSEANEQLTDYYKRSFIDAPGNINFWKNVILLNSENNIYTRNGWRIEFFDSFNFSMGSVEHENGDDIDTYGYMINTFGLFKLLSSNNNSKLIQFISDHIKFYYAHSMTSVQSVEKKYDSITITIFGF